MWAVFIVLTVLFFTMVFPGLTLPWLVRVLGVSATTQKELDDEALRVATRQLPVVGGADARNRE